MFVHSIYSYCVVCCDCRLEKLLLEKSDLAVSLNGELEQVAKLRDAVQSAVEEHEKTQLQRQELHENTEKVQYPYT